ncbi:MAG: hypothetical protein U9R79_21570 [Armatimonadota bacterium]|nr:hypothetical protein [Armatimonadota bacterium]
MRIAAGVWVIAAVVLVLGSAAQADEAGPVTDLGAELGEDNVRQARIDFGKSAGFTEQQMRMVFGTKFHLHRLQERLRADLEAMAVAVLDDAEPREARAAAVEEYLRRRQRTMRQMEQIQQRLIQAVGADEDPLKMGALLVFGVVDSGRRVLCAVQSEIAGGGSGGIKHDEMGAGLQQPLGP